MTDLTLTKLRIAEGAWTGRLTGGGESDIPPELQATHLDRPVPGLRLVQERDMPGAWLVHVPIPVEALSEGLQTILIREAASGETLASFAILTGEPLEDDIRGEVDLLRAELDMLKKAFRRHCTETGNH